MSTDDPSVVDDAEHDRFLYRHPGGDGVLAYRLDGRRLILTHTEVAEALRGQGVAGRLVEAAVERAARSGLTLVPWCPYARRWLREHAERVESISIDWSEPPVA